MSIIKGRVLKYGDNINTDIISPPQYMELSIADAAKYAMTAVDADFPTKMRSGDIMVAGANFGSGSSRETSPLTLRYLGVGAIVAKFFARIFYRNAINLGIPVIECAETDKISDLDEIEIDLASGMINGDLKAGTLTVAAGSRIRGPVECGWGKDDKPAPKPESGAAT